MVFKILCVLYLCLTHSHTDIVLIILTIQVLPYTASHTEYYLSTAMVLCGIPRHSIVIHPCHTLSHTDIVLIILTIQVLPYTASHTEYYLLTAMVSCGIPRHSIVIHPCHTLSHPWATTLSSTLNQCTRRTAHSAL